MKRVLSLLAAFAMAGAAYGEPLVLQADGLGNIKIGMGVDQVERLLVQKLPYQQFANHGCGVVTTKYFEPYGISLQIESKILTRINLEYYGSDPRPLTVKTDTGLGLGASEEDVLKAYGSKARVQPNPGDPTWHTIFVDVPDHSRAVVFETNGKTVKTIRAGNYPAVGDNIGCR